MDWPPKPAVFTPFFRRFEDEGRRERGELAALYDSVTEHQRRFTTTPVEVGADAYGYFDYVSEDLSTPLIVALDALIRDETFIFDLPPPEFGRMNMKERVVFRDFLRRKQYFFENSKQVLAHLHECLVRIFGSIADELPQTSSPTPFTIPLIYALPHPKEMIEKTYGTICESQYEDRGLFLALRDRMYRNLCAVSDIEPYEVTTKKLRFKHVSDSDLPLDKINDTYCAGTAFHALYNHPVPLKITHHERFNHMHVLGGTGAGKTTLLENLIHFDLTSEDRPALVIVDSQGDLIRKVSHLALFHPDTGTLGDKLILITPKDIRHPPALNVFDLNLARLGTYDDVVREQVMAGAIQTFDYLFSGLIGADLTAKQGVFFKYVARLMLSLPQTMGRNATILDMMHLMEDPAPYRAAIEALPPIQRNFFERDFGNKTFAQTKEQIRYRLQAIIENPTIARLFTSTETRVDLFSELNGGSVILVDTAKDFLKGSSSHFGRIFISLVLQAVLERAALPEADRRPAFLIVDEAASYFDSNIDDLLTEARKYRCGCVFAHQYLDQATPALKASLAANTSIKFAASISMNDARQMAPDMRTTPDFILSQPRLHFAAHIRNVTPQAVSIPVPIGRLEREPQLSNDEYRLLLECNRERVSLGHDAAGVPAAAQPAPQEDSDDW
jgi:Type IV secretion-system coupling protein DNA-binding domain